MTKVLNIEYDANMAEVIRRLLSDAGIDVEHRGDVTSETLAYVGARAHDIIIVDVKQNNLGFLRFINEESVSTPVIVLSTFDTIEDKVAALKAGADDYIIKPFHNDELMARIEALLRRPVKHQNDFLLSGNLRLCVSKRNVTVNKVFVNGLSPQAFTLLYTLLKANGEPVSHRELVTSLYGEYRESNSFSVVLSRLKVALQSAGWTQSIDRPIPHVDRSAPRAYIIQDAAPS